MITNVAIVEDDAVLRQSLEWLLTQTEGFACAGTCRTGEEAVKLLPKLKPHVVLMDLNLPQMSGTECIRKLKEVMPKVPFIVLTVYEDSEHIFQALKAGASGYLLKRTTGEKLVEAIHEALLGGMPLTRQMAGKVVGYFQRHDATASEIAALSRRERETLALLAEGYRYKEIAERLGISAETVREYVHSTYRKLHVSSRTEAVVKFLNR